MSQSYINVIGAGLAGSEAAYQIAQQGIWSSFMKCVESNPLQQQKQTTLLS